VVRKAAGVAHKPRQLVLPVMASGPADIGRLLRELELIDQALLQSGLRDKEADAKLPQTSRLMTQITESNKLDLLSKLHRVELQHFLETVKEKSPVLHMSFSADPSPLFMEKLMTWLRREIHPSVLLTIGLQPTLGAGCILRTTNKQFDFSLREEFLSKRELLIGQLAAPAARAPARAEEAAA
jgi:F0F1-type ATP synthase delta subunit